MGQDIFFLEVLQNYLIYFSNILDFLLTYVKFYHGNL